MRLFLLVPLLAMGIVYPCMTAEVEVKGSLNYSYSGDTISNFRVSGRYGRYLRFIARTPSQYIYELDCKDKIFNRIGDRSNSTGAHKGWM